MDEFILNGAVFMLVAVIVLVIDICCIAFYKKKRKRCTIEVEATLVECIRIRKRTSEGIEHYNYPVYEYQYNGVTHKVQSKMAKKGRELSVGKRSTMFINPNNPEEFIVKSFLLYLTMAVISIVSVMFGFFAIVMFVVGMLS